MVGRLALRLVRRSLDRSMFHLNKALSICLAERGLSQCKFTINFSLRLGLASDWNLELLGGTTVTVSSVRGY
jgi:hypothetical protein